MKQASLHFQEHMKPFFFLFSFFFLAGLWGGGGGCHLVISDVPALV